MGKTMNIKREEVNFLLHVLQAYKTQMESFKLFCNDETPINRMKAQVAELRVEDTEHMINKLNDFIIK